MKKISKFIKSILPEKDTFFLLSGVGCIFFGLYQIYEPSAYIVTGILLGFIGYIQIPTQASS